MTINVIQVDDEYRITFKYNPEIIQLVKNIPGRRWDSNKKYWTIPSNHLGILIAQFKNTKYESQISIRSNEELNLNPTLDETTVIPEVDLTGWHRYVKLGGHLYSHQIDFMKYGIDRENKHNMNGFLVCDEMGCIAGDAKIYMMLNNKCMKMSLRDAYQIYNINRSADIKILRWVNNKFEYSAPLKILYKGLKKVYKLACTNGYEIKATEDHKILTDRGYVELKDLNIYDRIASYQFNSLQYQLILNITPFVILEDVYDIVMPDPYHNFVVNGIIVHNCGKALPLDTKIPTPEGYKLLKDINIGDTIFDEKGQYQQVLNTYTNYDLNMFDVKFSDGSVIRCCEDHLWGYMLGNTDNISVKSLSEMFVNLAPEFNREFKPKRGEYYLPITDPVQYPEQPLPLDPWLIGAWLGDGSSTNGGITYTTSYPDILEEVKKRIPLDTVLSQNFGIDYHIVRKPNSYYILCETTGEKFKSIESADKHFHGVSVRNAIAYRNGYSRDYRYKFKVIGQLENSVVKIFKQLGLIGTKSYSKFIPKIYLQNSIENRWLLLQGLMDTDGYADKWNSHSYTTTSKQLAEDVIELVRGLGGITTIQEHIGKYNGKETRINYTIGIRFKDTTNLYLASKRKLSRTAIRSRSPRRKFVSATYVGKQPGKCLSVSGESKLYLCDQYFVTHNTLESINLALYNKERYNFKHCLILCCVNTSKYNWKQEIEEQTNGEYEGYILGSRIRRNGTINPIGSSKDKYQDLVLGNKYNDEFEKSLPYFIIMNVEALRYSEGSKHLITNKLIELINLGQINMIIIDEVHKNVSPKSQQGKQLLQIKKSTKKKCMWLPMTGTPIVNKPTDLFLPLRLIEAHSINSYYTWNKTFCVFGGYGDHEIVGYKNMNQLKMLLQPNMIRRLKDTILDLPDKIEILEYVENTSIQNKLKSKIEMELRTQRASIVKSLNPLSKLLRLRQVNGSPELIDEDIVIDLSYLKKNAKLKRLLEILEDIHERNEKVIIFSNWVEPLRTIYRFIANKYKVCCYTGTMTEIDRDKNKKLFQENSEYTIIIGTIGSLGTSHTLTAANNVIFYDEPWTAADRQQSIDRVHRIGATKSVNVYTLLSKDTVDERVHKILYGKNTISKYIVDNQLDIYNNPELFDILLGDEK